MTNDRQPGEPAPPRNPSQAAGQHGRDTPLNQHTPSAPGGAESRGLVLAPGMRPLPDYELVQLLGRGGFGEVWKARGAGGFDVALKFVRLGDQGGRIELRFLELMKNVRHAHLLALFGAWQIERLLIIAMELGDRTLLDRLREVNAQGRAGIPGAELLEYMREAAKGIDYLNEYRHPAAGQVVGIQHKDVKPQNLLLVGGTVKVADFGLARLLTHTITNATGNMTPAYAAPEFLSGQATRWSDQYCLAVSYCQLRGGRLPFEGTPIQVMAGHATQPPDLSMLPAGERPAVARALAKKPPERWPSCRAFVQALTARPAVAAAPPRREERTARTPQLIERPKETPPPSRPRKSSLTGAVALLVAVAMSVVIGLVFVLNSSTPPAEAPPPPVAGSGSTLRPSPDSARKDKDPSPPSRDNRPKPVATLELLAAAELTLTAGKSQVLEVRVQRGHFQGPVELTADELPAKVRVRRVTLDADQNVARMEFTADAAAPPGRHVVRINGQGGTLGATRTTTLEVKAVPALTLATLKSVTVERGKTCSFAVRLKRQNCTAPVTLSVRDLPPGVRMLAAPVMLKGDAARIQLVVDAGVPVGESVIRVVGAAGELTAETTLRLRVTGVRAGRRVPIDRYIPADAELVVHVNVRQILNSPLARKHLLPRVEKGLKDNPAIQQTFTRLDLDPLKDVTGITVTNAGVDGTRFQVVFHGKFNVDKIQKVAETGIFKSTDVAGKKLYSIEGTPPSIYFAFASARALVVSLHKDYVVDALVGKTRTVNQALAAAIAAADFQPSAWAAMLLTDEMKKAATKSGNSAAPFLSKIETVIGGVNVTDAVAVSLRLKTTDAKAAREVADLTAATVKASGEGVKGTAAVLLDELMKTLKVNTENADVNIRFQFRGEIIEKIEGLSR